MVSDLSIAIFQYDIEWENPHGNIEKLNRWIDTLNRKVDIIFLPEMFLTGFSMDIIKTAQPMDGEGVKWLEDVSKKTNAIVMGSLAVNDNEKYYNRLLVAHPNGDLQFYDKRHLFRMGDEHSIFSKGTKTITVNCHNVKIRPLVCYDLRFPVWSRNVNQDYDVLVYVTNWPSVRKDAYLTLLKARAIENQCFVIGVNCTGTDGNGLHYNGDSIVFDPKGICLTTSTEESVLYASLSITDLYKFREKFPVHLDADEFAILNNTI